MSGTLLIAPHADDETLFASYLAQRYEAGIAVVYDEGRSGELFQAGNYLGCPTVNWGNHKGASPAEIRMYFDSFSDPPERVIYPAELVGGHEEHNIVSRVVVDWCQEWPGIERIEYLTYAPRGRRVTDGVASLPEKPEHIARKLMALSCYRSQIEDPATAPWFYDLLDMREWLA